MIATADMTLARLEELSEVLAGKGRVPALDRIISHYRITPSLLMELADMVDTALASVSGAVERTAGDGKEAKDLVLAFLATRPREAIPLETILGELGRHGISPGDGTRAVNELLAEGECYMPRKGSIRLA